MASRLEHSIEQDYPIGDHMTSGLETILPPCLMKQPVPFSHTPMVLYYLGGWMGINLNVPLSLLGSYPSLMSHVQSWGCLATILTLQRRRRYFMITLHGLRTLVWLFCLFILWMRELCTRLLVKQANGLFSGKNQPNWVSVAVEWNRMSDGVQIFYKVCGDSTKATLWLIFPLCAASRASQKLL